MHPCYSMYQYFMAFYGWIISHCLNIPHFIYLFSWWIISRVWLFWTVLLWLFVYKFLFEQFSVFLGIYLGMDLLGHGNSVFNLLRNWKTVFPVVVPFYTSVYESPDLSTSFPKPVLFHFLIMDILVGMNWYRDFNLHFRND